MRLAEALTRIGGEAGRQVLAEAVAVLAPRLLETVQPSGRCAGRAVHALLIRVDRMPAGAIRHGARGRIRLAEALTRIGGEAGRQVLAEAIAVLAPRLLEAVQPSGSRAGRAVHALLIRVDRTPAGAIRHGARGRKRLAEALTRVARLVRPPQMPWSLRGNTRRKGAEKQRHSTHHGNRGRRAGAWATSKWLHRA